MDHIPIDQWGRDHWSTFAYIETCIVDDGGKPDIRRMRTDVSLHPNMGPHECVDGMGAIDGAQYPTRLRGGATASPHDDWSCLDDAEAEGLIQNEGTGTNRRYVLTNKGRPVANALRDYLARNRTSRGFDPFPSTAPTEQAERTL